MPGSISFVTPGQVPGLTLRAWALVANGGGLIKSYNVGSFVRNSAGNFTITFATAMPDANVLLELIANATSAGTAPVDAHVQAVVVGSLVYQTHQGGTPTDPAGNHWIGVYG